MARIARRALRIRDLPLLCPGKPWSSMSDASGNLAVRLYLPEELEFARRVLPPIGSGRFGYAEKSDPEKGNVGILAQVEGYRWESDDQDEISGRILGEPNALNQPTAVVISARAEVKFRVLSTQPHEVESGESPLYTAHIQQLANRDLARGDKQASCIYWSSKMHEVKEGTALIARQQATVYESVDNWRVVSHVPAGVVVISAGPVTMTEGHTMVPIAPSGAVELTNFRTRVPGQDTLVTPTEEEVKHAIMTITAESQSANKDNRRKTKKESHT